MSEAIGRRALALVFIVGIAGCAAAPCGPPPINWGDKIPWDPNAVRYKSSEIIELCNGLYNDDAGKSIERGVTFPTADVVGYVKIGGGGFTLKETQAARFNNLSNASYQFWMASKQRCHAQGETYKCVVHNVSDHPLLQAAKEATAVSTTVLQIHEVIQAFEATGDPQAAAKIDKLLDGLPKVMFDRAPSPPSTNGEQNSGPDSDLPPGVTELDPAKVLQLPKETRKAVWALLFGQQAIRDEMLLHDQVATERIDMVETRLDKIRTEYEAARDKIGSSQRDLDRILRTIGVLADCARARHEDRARVVTNRQNMLATLKSNGLIAPSKSVTPDSVDLPFIVRLASIPAFASCDAALTNEQKAVLLKLRESINAFVGLMHQPTSLLATIAATGGHDFTPIEHHRMCAAATNKGLSKKRAQAALDYIFAGNVDQVLFAKGQADPSDDSEATLRDQCATATEQTLEECMAVQRQISLTIGGPAFSISTVSPTECRMLTPTATGST